MQLVCKFASLNNTDIYLVGNTSGSTQLFLFLKFLEPSFFTKNLNKLFFTLETKVLFARK